MWALPDARFYGERVLIERGGGTNTVEAGSENTAEVDLGALLCGLALPLGGNKSVDEGKPSDTQDLLQQHLGPYCTHTATA